VDEALGVDPAQRVVPDVELSASSERMTAPPSRSSAQIAPQSVPSLAGASFFDEA
jgi:hypothetical protein